MNSSRKISELLTAEDLADLFRGRRIAIIGSGPSCLDNDGSEINSFDYIVRINNYKMRDIEDRVGSRTDVYYSFFGRSIRKTASQLRSDGVEILMNKLPNDRPIESEWHVKNGKEIGIDFRITHQMRKNFWFCPVYIPTTERFLKYFNLLDRHVPTTGFQCLLEFFSFDCGEIYITGFDGFRSGVHNVNEKWIDEGKGNDDPIWHEPEKELEYLRANLPANAKPDRTLEKILGGE